MDSGGSRKAAAMPLKAGAMPFRAGAMPLKAGAMPFKAGAMPFKAGAMPFKAGAMPFKASAMPFETAAYLGVCAAEKAPYGDAARRSFANLHRRPCRLVDFVTHGAQRVAGAVECVVLHEHIVGVE